MRRSEIFESFVKIAQEKGLVSKADHAEHTEKDFSEPNPRMDSLTIEQISKLYNTRPPPSPESIKYKKNIMEAAHPDPMVISPAHDKLNGLIENEIEGQNIRLRIVHKEPDGHLTNRKYAQSQLVHTLVKIANQLDNRDQTELCQLADVCLLQASDKRLEKKAWWPIAVGIAAAIGIIYAKQHLRFHSDGFKADLQKAYGEINDLLNSNSNFGVGYQYTPAFLQTVTKLKEELGKLDQGVDQILPILDKIETPRTGEELKQIAQQPATQEAHTALENFKQIVEEVYPYINQTIINFGNEGFKQRAIAQKGMLSSLVDATDVLHGGGGLVADDFDDAKHALQTLKSDIDNVVKGLQASESAQHSAQQQISQVQGESSQLFESSKPQQEGAVSSLDDSAKGLLGSLTGK